MKIDLNKMARRVEVDNRLPLPYYLRIADSLLRQASIYREEKNIVDLYVILLRYTSLVTETIPSHRDYKTLPARDKSSYVKRSLAALDELESLKPDAKRRVDELNEEAERSQHYYSDVLDRTSFGFGSSLEWPPANRISYSSMDVKQAASLAPQSLWKYENHHIRASSTAQIEKQLNKLTINLPLPKQDTLSRHSFLGPNGFRGQWLGPTSEIKIQYPSNTDLTSSEDSSLNQVGQYGMMAEKDSDSGRAGSDMESVLSLDDGRWSLPAEESFSTVMNQAREDPFQFVGIKQPSPPPVLAQVKHEYAPLPPSKVADPRPGPAVPSQDGTLSSNSYQHLHVPVNLMEDFLRLARANTARNLETCGVLAGLLKNRVFHITTLIIPKQESTSDSCQTLNEEEIFEVQDRLSLFPLGWIHTHPSQTCFMSSVDLHTHYSYQIMLPEAIAIVMAPTDETSPHGIFHLSDPGGVSVIRSCQQRGFHPHEEPLDGSPIYEHCSHVYMNSKLKFDVVDLR